MMGSLCLTGAIMGLTLGSLVGLIIHTLFSEEDVLEWGWRIPFLSGVLIGAFAVWIRNGESPVQSRNRRMPALGVFVVLNMALIIIIVVVVVVDRMKHTGLDESAEYEQSQFSSTGGNAADNALGLEEESTVEGSASSGAAVKPALEGTPLWTR
jgi:MFS family permease